MTTGVFPSNTSPFRQKLGAEEPRGGGAGMRGCECGHSRLNAAGHRHPDPYLKSMALSPISIPVRTVASSRSMMAPES